MAASAAAAAGRADRSGCFTVSGYAPAAVDVGSPGGVLDELLVEVGDLVGLPVGDALPVGDTVPVGPVVDAGVPVEEEVGLPAGLAAGLEIAVGLPAAAGAPGAALPAAVTRPAAARVCSTTSTSRVPAMFISTSCSSGA